MEIVYSWDPIFLSSAINTNKRLIPRRTAIAKEIPVDKSAKNQAKLGTRVMTHTGPMSKGMTTANASKFFCTALCPTIR